MAASHPCRATFPEALRSVVDVVRWRAEREGEARVFTFLGDDAETVVATLSFAELDRRARALAAWLAATATPGERALLVFRPGADYVVAVFGCLYADIVAVPVYPPQGGRARAAVAAIAGSASATLALGTAAVLAGLGPSIAALPALARLRWLATDGVPAATAAAWRPPARGDDVAVLQFTSGSTGDPQGVVLAHQNLLANARLMDETRRRRGYQSGLSWLPPYHDLGLIGWILQPVIAGGPVVLVPPLACLQRPLRWLAAIARFGAEASGAPNFAYELCLRTIGPAERETLDLRCWTTAFIAAEPIRAETLRRFAAAFAPAGFRADAFCPCWGLAEATLMVSASFARTAPVVRAFERAALEAGQVVPAARTGAGVTELVACGEPGPGARVVVADPETRRQAADDRVGELWVAGPTVARGYWQRPDASAATFDAQLATGEGPFLRTGDLGFVAGGLVYVTGRRKDRIIVDGRNLWPQDLERTAADSGPGLRADGGAAFALPGAATEHVVVVQEVERADRCDAVAAAAAIHAAIADGFGVAPLAVLVVRPGAIPRTTSGKVRRSACRTAFLDGALEPIAAWPPAKAGVDAA